MGEKHHYKRLKNFGYDELIPFYKEFEILGPSSDALYTTLKSLGHFRNRVHIRNYFGNFEADEFKTFSEVRTQRTINIMGSVIQYISENYPRP